MPSHPISNVIAKGTSESSPRTDAQWHRAARAEPMWKAKAGRSLLQKVAAQTGEGRFFDDSGRLRHGASELLSIVGSSDLYKLANPIADREESDRPYEENVWVRAAIKAISEGFVRMPLQIYPEDPGSGVEPLASHPLLDLLADPNRVMTPTQFWRAHVINMKHDGESVWFMMDESGAPVQSNPQTRQLQTMPASVVPVRGSLVEIQYDAGGMPLTYRYTTSYSRNSSKVSPAFPAGSVVHYRDYDPYNFARGLGDVDSLERETDLYFQAFRAMDASVRNGGDPGGFIIYDHEVDAAEMQRRQGLADDEFSGPNQRRVKLLQSSAKFVPNPVKPSDMQYQTLLTWLRDSILSGIGVPPPCVGVYDNATYNNVETAHRELWTGANGILSMANSAADVLTNDLLPRMLRIGSAQGTVAHFNSSHIEALQRDVGEQLERAANISAKGIGVSYSEVLQQQGVEVEQPEEGDLKFTATSLQLLVSQEAATADGPANEGEIAADPETTLNGAQIASLLTVVEQVAAGLLPKDTAVQIIVASFPFDERRAQRILQQVDASGKSQEPSPSPKAPEPESDDTEQASRTTLADKDRIDEVYSAWRAVVNMSASELEAWGKTECSRKASLNPSAVIKRNVALMRKKKAEWGSREVKAANRAISFISRMKGMPRGNPVGDCPSKRDISLRNWGFDPGSSRNRRESNAGAVGCCEEGTGETAALERAAGELYEHLWDDGAGVALARHQGVDDYADKALYGQTLGWIEDYEKAQIAKLRRIANGSFRRLSIFDDPVNPEALNQAAWAALLLDPPKWAEKLDLAVRSRLAEVFSEAMQDAASELGAGVVSSTDPRVIQRIATQRIGLVEGVNSVTERRVRNAIAGVFTKLHPPGNLRQVVQQSLPELTEELRRVFGTKEARAATISATETGKAQNQGKFTQYDASNVTKIRWRASNDQFTRPTHLAADGIIREMGELFPNGLRYPHDPDGRASEVINCRCTYTAVERRDPLDDPDIEIA